MPNHTVSTNVDTMLRAADNAAIRSAIGLGQTDAPTFLNFTATGAFSSAPRFAVTSDFLIVPNGSSVGIAFSGGPFLSGTGTTDSVQLRNNGGTAVVRLAVDANEILAQRNGTNAQTFRVYNTFPGTTANEWFEIDWKSTANVAKIGTAHAGTGGSRGMEINAGLYLNINVGGSAVMELSSSAVVSGKNLTFLTDNLYDIGASGANRPRTIYAASNIQAAGYQVTSSGIAVLGHNGSAVVIGSSAWNTQHNGLAFLLGGTTDAFPAIVRDGAGIKLTGAAAGLTSWIKVPPVVIASLPSAVTAGVGARAFVTDALAPMFGSAVASGGTVAVPVYSNGTNWFVG